MSRSTRVYAEPDDPRLGRLAFRQHGVVCTRQLLALGISNDAITALVRAGHLHRGRRGVYAVGHTRLTRQGRWMAAVLACGERAVLSHRAAAALYGLYGAGSGPIEVTVATNRRLPGLRCHRAKGGLHPDDHTVVDAIPVTTIPRLCLDIAETQMPRVLSRILENVQRQDKLNLFAFDALLARSRGRHGIKPLTVALQNLRDDPPWTQSELEDAFLELVKRAGLPTPLTNQFVAGILVDAYWPQHRLVVEVDGWNTHKTKRSFEDDRRRDVTLQIAGYRVARFTRDRIMHHPAAVARGLRALLLNLSGPSAPAVEASGR